MNVPTEFFTWAMLGTLAGAASAVMVVVQMTKGYLSEKMSVRLYCWALSYVVLTAAALFSGELSFSAAGLNVFNSAIVALTAMGMYEVGIDYVPAVFVSRGAE
jgi:hypothetical protein